MKTSTTKKRKSTLKPIEIDPQKDYVLLVPLSISQQEWERLSNAYADKPNVVLIAADAIEVIHIK